MSCCYRILFVVMSHLFQKKTKELSFAKKRSSKDIAFPKVIILQAVYFKLRFILSYRDVE